MKIQYLSFAIIIFLCSIVTQASMVGKPKLEQLTRDADLIFQGTLINIEYRDSAGGVAHTFATYKVEEVLKGVYQKPSIALRFTGGFKKNGKSRERLIVSHAPRFTKGEQGIMMVRGNGEAETICPLVDCIKGRFMLEGPYIITAYGAVLATDTTGKLSYISRSQARKSQTHTIAMNHDSFVTYLGNIIARQKKALQNPMSKDNQRVVISADPNIPFVIKNKEAYQ